MATTIGHTKMNDWSPDGFRTAFLTKTADYPRPTAGLYPGMHATTLERAQAGWDAAKETDTKLAAHTAEGDRKRAEQRRAEEAAAEQRRQRVEDAWLAPAKAEYLRRGGTPEQWERDKAAIAADARRRAAARAVPADAVRSLVNANTL